MENQLTLKVCRVCQLLDNDNSLKMCRYCSICSSWICKNDWYRLDRRSMALARRYMRDNVLDKIVKRSCLAMICLLIVFVIVNYGWAQAPTSYTVARTDKNITQLPSPMPKWGPTGLGQKYCNKDYNNICTIRLTDSTTFANKASALSVEDGKETPISKSSNFIMVSNSNGSSKLVTFNPKTEAVGTTSIIFNTGPAEFSYNNNNIIWQRQNKTQIYKLTTKTNWKSVDSAVLFYDFKNCLPSGYNPTWASSWNVSSSDTSFVSIYSNNGGQGSGGNVVAYKKGVGCATLNTLTGQVTDFTGKSLGTYDDGNNPLSDRFVVHDGGTGFNSGFMNIEYSVQNNGPTKGSGCLAGNCANNDPYFWEVGTTHLRPCGPYNCGGHGDSGALHYADGKNLILHLFSNLSQPLLKLAKLPCCGYDFQGSWNNTDGSDDQPLFGVTQLVTTGVQPPVTGPYQNEVFAVAPDGSKAWRFSPTYNSGTSPYYICQNSHMSVSMDGKWIFFSSDMGGNGALGYEADGKTSRCDAFVTEAK